MRNTAVIDDADGFAVPPMPAMLAPTLPPLSATHASTPEPPQISGAVGVPWEPTALPADGVVARSSVGPDDQGFQPPETWESMQMLPAPAAAALQTADALSPSSDIAVEVEDPVATCTPTDTEEQMDETLGGIEETLGVTVAASAPDNNDDGQQNVALSVTATSSVGHGDGEGRHNKRKRTRARSTSKAHTKPANPPSHADVPSRSPRAKRIKFTSEKALNNPEYVLFRLS